MRYEATYLGPHGSISTGWRRLECGEPRLIVASEMERLIRENPDYVLIVTEGDRFPVHRGRRLAPPVVEAVAPVPVEPPPSPPLVVAPTVEVDPTFADLAEPIPSVSVVITSEQVRDVAGKVSAEDAAELALILNTMPEATEADLRGYTGVGAATARKLLSLRGAVR